MTDTRQDAAGSETKRRPIYFFKDYLVDTFGQALHRIAINLPFDCPHRHASGGRGCTFCPEDGAGARHLKGRPRDIPAQIAAGVGYTRRRYGSDGPYIAYFQSFTTTNAEVEELRRIYQAVLAEADFRMMVVATRPDCVGGRILDLLADLNRQLPVWVELGVQTAHDKTLALINRGHDFDAAASAVQAIAARGMKCAAHVILGLPGEGVEEYRATASLLSELPLNGVKLHNLLVLKDAPLAELYRRTPFATLDETAYTGVLIDFLRRIPATWTVMRLTADAYPEEIIAPHWRVGKAKFIATLLKTMGESGVRQGDLRGSGRT